MLALGVGNLKPNDHEEEEEEEEEEPEAKEEVTALRANKVNLGLALRDYMRQAWCKMSGPLTPRCF